MLIAVHGNITEDRVGPHRGRNWEPLRYYMSMHTFNQLRKYKAFQMTELLQLLLHTEYLNLDETGHYQGILYLFVL